MHFENLHGRFRWLLSLGLALGATLPAAGDPAAAAMADIRSQVQDQLWRQQMNSFSGFHGEGKSGTSAMPALLRIHMAGGTQEGMGHLYALEKGVYDAPNLSWVELSGKRYLPEDTDSIQVWDVTGIPKGRNWIFLMARGTVTAVAWHPGFGAQYYTRRPQGTQDWLNEADWKNLDSLKEEFSGTARLEAEQGDFTMAVRIHNEARHEQAGEGYLGLLEDAERLCKRKKFPEADALLAKAENLDPHYPRLHAGIGRCRERRGEYQAALASYRQALRHAGQNRDFRKDMEKKIDWAESRLPKPVSAAKPRSSPGTAAPTATPDPPLR